MHNYTHPPSTLPPNKIETVWTEDMSNTNTKPSVYQYYDSHYIDYYYNSNGSFHEVIYEDYLYFGIHFERPIYVYVWPLLVLFATAANMLLIITLLRKPLRTSTNIVLIGIASTEMLTLIVTIPSYILAYSDFEDGPSTDVYVLTKDWCDLFMVCKFFMSKAFRTASIWLHCFLGFHRLMGIWKPFKFHKILGNRLTLIVVVLIYACAPAPHISRAMHDYSVNGLCGWYTQERCRGGCQYSLVILILVDLGPCVFLSTCTVAMVVQLVRSTHKLGSTEMLSTDHYRQRSEENRRSSILVTAVVLSLLIPEIPYVIYLIYLEFGTHDRTLDREFHTAYEVLIALSYTTNFFINTVLNRTFRRELNDLFTKCLLRVVPPLRKLNIFAARGEYNINDTTDTPEFNVPQITCV